MKGVYSWSEAEQVIEFYEQIKEYIGNGWQFTIKKKTFAAKDPETGVSYVAETLEILLSHIRFNREI
jgi:hypothetical protein